MARREQRSDDDADALHHLADRAHDVLAGWIVAITLLLGAALAIGPDWAPDRHAVAPANPSPEILSETGDVLMDDRSFAPAVIVAHPNDRIAFRNVGDEPQALTFLGHEDILQAAFVEPGASFTFVIPPTLGPGTYRLASSTHDNMSAGLVVRARRGQYRRLPRRLAPRAVPAIRYAGRRRPAAGPPGAGRHRTLARRHARPMSAAVNFPLEPVLGTELT